MACAIWSRLRRMLRGGNRVVDLRLGRVLRALGQPAPLTEEVVRLEQLRLISDVHPQAWERVAVDRRALDEPGREPPRLVGRVSFLQVLLQQRGVLAVVDVRRRRREVALWIV